MRPAKILNQVANVLLVIAIPILAWQWNNARIARNQLEEGQQLGQLAIGDVVGHLEVTTADGPRQLVPEAAASPTLVMAFRSTCGYCWQAAPAWQKYLDSPPAGVRIIALSNLDLETERAYAEANGWSVEVGVVSGVNGSLALQLLANTPWVFVLDTEGRVLYEGLGSELSRIPTELFGDAS